jgi:hypothetical protein
MSRKKATAPIGKAPVFSPTNALGPTTGTVRVAPQRMWSNKSLEGMAKNRNRVEVSRFLQDEIPVVKYAVQTLPKEAIGKGLGTQIIRTLIEGELRGKISWFSPKDGGTKVAISIPI